MTALTWDKAGDRTFQTGVDRGVLYLPDKVVPWNGLTSVEDDTTQDVAEVYLDGAKYLHVQNPGDFTGTLKAYTYPDEFDAVVGNVPSSVAGVTLYDQGPRSFDLSYRTKIGNDLNGADHGYRIHLLYNLMATPDTRNFATMDSSIKALEFSWKLTTTPTFLVGRRPTCHVSFASTEIDPEVLTAIEGLLYGNSEIDPYLPPFDGLAAYLGLLVVVDNGDGTVTFTDHYDRYISPTEDGDEWTVRIGTRDDVVNAIHTFDRKTL